MHQGPMGNKWRIFADFLQRTLRSGVKHEILQPKKNKQTKLAFTQLVYKAMRYLQHYCLCKIKLYYVLKKYDLSSVNCHCVSI